MKRILILTLMQAFVLADLSDCQAKATADGYASEVYTDVRTTDGYVLSLFRITGKLKSSDTVITTLQADIADPQNKVILMQPDSNMSAQEWLLFTDKENTLPYLLSDQGYDVWIGNNRGTVSFTSHESLDAVDDAAEYWDFSFIEMGRYDLEAEISFIRQLTGVKKVTFLGYGHGNTQMFYGLAIREKEFYATNVDKIIALGPCFIIRDGITKFKPYFEAFKKASIENVYGPSWEEDYQRLCGTTMIAEACKTLKDYRALPQPRSVKDYKVSAQQALANRFQQYIPEGTYVEKMPNTLIPLEEISFVPVHYLVAGDDERCTVEDAQKGFEAIETSKDFLLYRTLKNEDFLQASVFIDDLEQVLLASATLLQAGLQLYIGVALII